METPSGDTQTAQLVARWRSGDQQAAGELFRRYLERLIRLARQRVPAGFNHRIDPEDVVQSVYRTFFAGARAGRFTLERGGDLWRLLVAITRHKVHNQVKKQAAGKRAAARESAFGMERDLHGLPVLALVEGPSALDVVVLADEVEQLLRGLEPMQRRMLELRLQGYTLDEIAVDLKCSQRTVRRTLERVKEELHEEAGHT